MVQVLNIRSTTGGAARARRRGDARRLEILRAAGRTFRRRGFAAAGMREIADEADLSPGNLYHYFRGKDEILYFCQDHFLDRMLNEVESVRKQRGPAAQRLRQVLTAHVLCILDDVDGTAAHLEIDSLPGPLREAIVAKRDAYEHGLRRLITTGIRRGEFERCDAGIVARAILGALNWTVRWFRPDGRKTADIVADDLVAYLVAGLLRRDGESAAAGEPAVYQEEQP